MTQETSDDRAGPTTDVHGLLNEPWKLKSGPPKALGFTTSFAFRSDVKEQIAKKQNLKEAVGHWRNRLVAELAVYKGEGFDGVTDDSVQVFALTTSSVFHAFK